MKETVNSKTPQRGTSNSRHTWFVVNEQKNVQSSKRYKTQKARFYMYHYYESSNETSLHPVPFDRSSTPL